MNDVQTEVVAKHVHNLLGFVQTQQTVVHEDAGQVLPMARCSSIAVTEESTPPERPRITLSSPTCWRIRSTASSMILPGSTGLRTGRCHARSAPACAYPDGCGSLPGGTARRRSVFFVRHDRERAAFGAGNGHEVGRDSGDFVAVAHPHVQQRFAVCGQESSIPRTSALSVTTSTCA